MLLSDRTIREILHSAPIIDPMPEDCRIQPASVDLLLGGHVTWASDSEQWDSFTHAHGASWSLEPGEFVLAHTFERVCLPNDIAARVEGKSSLGRRGLLIHSTAGFIDPGFHGQVTLELYNLGQFPVEITVGQPIAQICFYQLDRPAGRPYGSAELGSKYQNQGGATVARS